jgi:hypothetical protein
VHGTKEENEQAFPLTCKGVFYLLQNMHFLKTGVFCATRQELAERLSGRDRQVLEMASACGCGEKRGFDEAFRLLFDWCGESMIQLSIP